MHNQSLHPTILLLLTVTAFSASGARDWTVFEGDHVHIQANYDPATGAWEMGLNPEHRNAPLFSPENSVMVLGPGNRQTVPELPPAWDFMGEVGDTVWATALIGMAQYGVAPDLFTGGLDGQIRQTLVGFDGPGFGFMYQPAHPGNPLRFDPRTEQPPFGTVTLDAGGHTHYSWAFRERGIHFATLQASGTLAAGGVETVSEPVTFIFLVDPLPVHWWLLEHFGHEANEPQAALTADPGGNGLSNLLAYSFGLDPYSPSRAGLPWLEMRETNEGPRLWISLRRPEDRGDVGYVLETSSDLHAWDGVDWDSIETEWSADTDGTPLLSAKAPNPEIGTGRYLRVRIEWTDCLEP